MLTARRLRRLMLTDEATWHGHRVEESRRHCAAPRGVSRVVHLFVPLGERDRAERSAEISWPKAVYFDLSVATRLVSSPMMIALAGSPDSPARTPSAAPIRG